MRRLAGCVFIGAALLALTPAVGTAQDKTIHVNLGGGPTFNGGDLGEHFGTGWGPAIGVTFDASDRIGFQFEYAYRWFDIKDDVPLLSGATRFSANHKVHQLDFNLVANLTPGGSAVRPYIVVGPGMYHRSVEITEYVGNGVICDPYWYVCGTYPVTTWSDHAAAGTSASTSAAASGSASASRPSSTSRSRYHYVAGPEFQTATPIAGAAGTGGSANGTYYPLTFGFRF